MMRTLPSPRVFVGAVVAISAAGQNLACGVVDCSPCPPAMTIAITGMGETDPVGYVDIEATYSGGRPLSFSCAANQFSGGVTECSVFLSETGGGDAGEYSLTISAPGYEDTSLTVQVRPDSGGDDECSCGFIHEFVAVELIPAGSNP